MKTTTIKKSALALMACILALAFALVGCGGSKADPEEAFLGSWKLSGGEIYGEELDDETIETMEEWGLNCILILDEDGEGQLDLFGDVEDITWKVKSDGTVIGPHSNIYPTSCVRGVVPANSIWKTGGVVVKKV